MYIINVLVLTVLTIFSCAHGYIVPLCMEDGKEKVPPTHFLLAARFQVKHAVKDYQFPFQDSPSTHNSVFQHQKK